MRVRLALPVLASVAVGVTCVVAGCGESSTSATQPDASTRRAAAASTDAPVRVTSSRVCGGSWVSSDRVVVNFSNASSQTIGVYAWTSNAKDRNDRFTLPPKSAPASVRCNGGASTGIDLRAQVTWKEDELSQFLGWKNAYTGSDVVYCCDNNSWKYETDLSDPGQSVTFSKDQADTDLPFTSKVQLVSVRDSIPHFNVTFSDR